MASNQVTRRMANWSDRALIALGCAVLLRLCLSVPTLIPDFPWHGRSASPLLHRFALIGPGLDVLLEVLVFALALLGYQLTLRRFGLQRLRLTRALLGACLAVTLVGAAASVSAAAGWSALWLPTGLAGLWVSASFGLGPGLVTVLASLAVSVLVGASGVLELPLLIRAVALILLFQAESSSVRGTVMGRTRLGVGGLAAGCVAGALGALAVGAIELGQESASQSMLLRGSSVLAGGALEGALYWLSSGAGERLLGHVSRERLVALLDLSQPLLQRMVHRAPGSFEHSRAMANLAEQAASSIGADALLTRVGAYYHDLGKSIEPKFFVENLDPGEESAHQGLSPEASAQHIVRHVRDGVALLREHGIPEAVVEFAYTHHGTQKVEYFLNRARQAGAEVDERLFAYPGMKPTNKETAILMLVDSIEAASRTLESPDRGQIEDLVRRIIFSKLAVGQLDDCELSMIELRIIAARVVETLVHMNHHRIKYPWQEERAREFGIAQDELAPAQSATEVQMPAEAPKQAQLSAPNRVRLVGG